MSSTEIPTQAVLYNVVSGTGFTVDVTSTNLDADLVVKDFIVINTSDNDAAISTTLWSKESRTVLQYNGPALTIGHVIQIGRSTELERVQETLQLGSTLSSSILDAEILRLYKLIAEKLAGFVVSNPVNNVTRSTIEPDVPPEALGDEWHVYDPGSSGPEDITIRVWVATDTTGVIDDNGWFEVTGTDGLDGNDGAAATVEVGTVTTGAPGTNAAVVNAGSSSAAVLNFTIPRGGTGATGPAGPAGSTGATGPVGPAGATGTVSSSSAIIVTESVAPTTGANQLGIYTVDSSTLSVRGELDGASKTLATLETPQTYTKAQRVATVTLTDAATIATDALLGNIFKVTLGGNRTLGAPTNLVDGQTLIYRIIQDATGGRTLAFASAFRFPDGTDPVVSAGANDVSYLSCVSDGTNVDCVASLDFA